MPAVTVTPMTLQTVQEANRSPYQPLSLPAAFSRTAGFASSGRTGGAAPAPVFDAEQRPPPVRATIPPQPPIVPYTIGVGDVLLLATPSAGSTVEQLSGLLAAQNSRQGYTVQDDGAIAIPNVGRVNVAGMTIEEAEEMLFQELVKKSIEPTFSLEIAEFGSKRVTIGGAVANPTVAPIKLSPLKLREVIQLAGGVNAPDLDYVTFRIYRDGRLYQIPAREFFERSDLQEIRVVDGDSIFVDTTYQLDQAKSYFEEQIALAEFRQRSRTQSLQELDTEISLRRAELSEARNNFSERLDLDGVNRDYVYLSGEVEEQSRIALPFDQKASLADALFGQGGLPTREANPSQIYVLRARDMANGDFAVTAYQLDGKNAAYLLLATRFEMRPDDIIFVSEQPVTKWNRVVSQITPALISTAARATGN
jgi:polysaccharide export outer membrane protein